MKIDGIFQNFKISYESDLSPFYLFILKSRERTWPILIFILEDLVI